MRDHAGGRDPHGEVPIRAAVGDAGGGQGEPPGNADGAAEDAEVEEHRRRRNICGRGKGKVSKYVGRKRGNGDNKMRSQKFAMGPMPQITARRPGPSNGLLLLL